MTSILLAVVALLGSKIFALGTQCSVSDSQKKDCGYVGINQSQCESKGCCWASSNTNGVPWCFYGQTDSTCYSYMASEQLPFSSSEMDTMRKYFNGNINIDGKGGVAAGALYDPPVGSYYYHWMRDGALTIKCLQETNPKTFADIESTVKAYASWVLHAQNEVDPNGIDVRVEPKFFLPNGEPYNQGWCRPQNDGPGLRATTLIMAAQNLITLGETAYVKQYLWTGDNNQLHGGAIKYDLDYIVGNYATGTCDLWEEVWSTDFFWNRMTMKKALIVGAQFARSMGDTSSATAYENTMYAINATLYASHYNGNYLQESDGRTIDSAVILALNHAYDSSDELFYPTSMEVAKTVVAYNNLFCGEYAVNRDDSAKGIGGVLYGRYGGDTYIGGNAWILSSGALAGLFYRGAHYLLTKGVVPSASVLAQWQVAFHSATALPNNDVKALAQIFANQGDAVLLRIRAHIASDNFYMYEQIDRNTGLQTSAQDLTWSYAEVLNAMHTRDLYYQQRR